MNKVDPSRQRFELDMAGFLRHVRRHWYLYLPIFGIWALAYVRLFFDPTPRLPLLFNWTPSLPYHLGLMQPKPDRLKRGDLVIYRFDGEAKAIYPGLHHQPFFKTVRGVPGDLVSVDGRTVQINGEAVGIAKTHTFDRRPLTPIASGVIPDGYYYVQGTSPDSFDSRYQASGLVRADQIVCSVYPLF